MLCVCVCVTCCYGHKNGIRAGERRGPEMGVGFWVKTSRKYSNLGLFNAMLDFFWCFKKAGSMHLSYEARYCNFL